MNNDFIKGVRLLLILIMIIIIIIISILFLVSKGKNKTANVNMSTNNNDSEENNTDEILKVTDNEKFFTVAGCISESIGDNYYFVPLKMNWKEGTDLDLYSVYGIVMDKNYENCQYVYYVVKLDSFNKIYSVKLLDGKYDDLDDIEIVDDKEKLEPNNKFSYLSVNDEYIIRTYMDYYKKIALSNPELFYNNYLDEDYKNKKFADINSFKEYINNNRNNIINLNATKYSIDNLSEYKQYTIEDNNNNYYIIKEKGIMDFSMLLDNYTINSEEFNEKYNSSSDKIKITTNVDKLFKMLNNKEYKDIYDNYLNSEFKNNYFSNYTDFEKFINERFFDYNYVGNITSENKGTFYLVNVNYKDGLSSAGELRNINLIMKLNDNADFEISFEME